jgi:dTDP-glucose 4,6-dehydratase
MKKTSSIIHCPSSIVITGGAGFIGSHLCDEYIKLGHQVICVDNLITGSKNNIKHLLNNPNFHFLNADVSTKEGIKKVQSLITNYKLLITHVLHFASPAGPNPNSPKSYLQYPIKTYLVNSIGTHYLLKLAKNYKAEFLFASTSEVYGNPLQHPQKETYFGNVNPIGNRSCYDESKRFGEMATITFAKKHKLTTKIVRIFNTYGPRMNPEDGRVIPQFITQSLKNKPITVYGTGRQTRSFCYIDDLVKGIIKVAHNSPTYEVFNIGNDKEIDIVYLAKAIKKLTNSKSKIIYKPLPKDDPEKRKPDLTKIKTMLKWEPKTNLEEGLNKVIDYFNKEAKNV